jgi:hypothetical protein
VETVRRTVARLRWAIPAVALVLGGCGATGAVPDWGPMPSRGAVAWSADHETGDVRQWSADEGGGVFNSGPAAAAAAAVPFARSGEHALELRIDVSGEGPVGARVFRWGERLERGFYGAWYYFPTEYRPETWWNVMQTKSRSTAGESETIWVVNVAADEDGTMRLYLWDALGQTPFPGLATRVERALPVGRWVHIELYVERATTPTGRIALFQDGELLLDLVDRVTAVSADLQWSVNNYSDAVTPSDVVIYVDDASILWAVPVLRDAP